MLSRLTDRTAGSPKRILCLSHNIGFVASTNSATASKLTSNPGRSPGLSQCPPLRRSRDRFTGPINPRCTFADCNQLGLQLQVAGVCLWLSDRLGDDCTRRWPYRAKCGSRIRTCDTKKASHYCTTNPLHQLLPTSTLEGENWRWDTKTKRTSRN